MISGISEGARAEAASVFISVVIPVHNGLEYADALVRSFVNQSYPRPQFEIILVDNRSTDNAAVRAYTKLVRSGLQCELVAYNDKPSSYGARNAGVLQARGELLAFTDFDCKPTETWLDVLSDSVTVGKIIAGQVELEIQNPRNLWEQLDGTSHMRNDLAALSAHLATANVALTRRDFERVGPFLEVESGGDFEWSRRAEVQGLKISYNPKAIVKHPTRKTYGEIRRKMLRISRGAGEIARERGWQERIFGLIRCVVRVPLLPWSSKVPLVRAEKYLWFRIQFAFIRLAQLKEYIGIALLPRASGKPFSTPKKDVGK